MADHPFLAENFHIPWSQLIPEKVEVDIEAGILEAQQRIDEICSVPQGCRVDLLREYKTIMDSFLLRYSLCALPRRSL